MKKVFVLGVQPDPDGPVFGRVMDPNDFQKSQDFAHEHINQVVRDLLVAGAASAQAAGFAAALAGGLNVSIDVGAVVDALGESYESPTNATVVALNAANPALPRIDLIYAALEIDTPTASEFRPFRRLRTQAELEAGTPEFPPAQFNQPTELHTRATIGVKTGVANANPVAPAAGANEVPLWTVHVAAAQVNLVNGDLTDVRVRMKSLYQALLDITVLQAQMAALGETVQDIVGVFILEGPGIDVVYNDIANQFTVSLEPALKALLDNATNANNISTLVKRDAQGNFAAGIMDLNAGQTVLGAGTAATPGGLRLRAPTNNVTALLTLMSQVEGGTKFVIAGDVSQNSPVFQIYHGRGPNESLRMQIGSLGEIAFVGNVSIFPASDPPRAGDLAISGNLSKASGTFEIDHPLDPANKDLRHAFAESPRFLLIYDGEATLAAGQAVVDIDQSSGMSNGTFAALTRKARVFLQNKDGFTRVKHSPIVNGQFTIIAEDSNCEDTVAWSVQCERQDVYIRKTPISDDDGNLIVETDKPEPDLGLLNPTTVLLHAQQPAPDRQDTEVVWQLAGTKGFPRHAHMGDPQSLPTRVRTFHTVDMNGNEFED
jgi:hypothetical protein